MNESQLRAVQSVEGALLLLAGPGSGKTTVITHRIQYLISNLGVSPDKILVITFTKAAAMEMKERFLHLMKPIHQSHSDDLQSFPPMTVHCCHP